MAAGEQHLPSQRRSLLLLGPGPTAPAKVQEAPVRVYIYISA